jgi:hypothetical protein
VMDKAAGTVLNKALRAVGGMLKEALKDPDMPLFLTESVDRATEVAWAKMEQQIKEAAHGAFSYKVKSWQDTLARFRAKAPKFYCDQRAFGWFRAKFLYALMPADGTFWTTMRDPACLAIRVLLFLPVSSVLLFVSLFFMITKRDEYQLIEYVVTCKSYQALSVGLISMWLTGTKMYGCMEQLDQLQAGGQDVIDVDLICSGFAPASTPLARLTLALEPLRLLTAWAAFVLCVSGYARGGEEQLKALEEIRLDAADGTLDGKHDRAKAESRERHGDHSDDEVLGNEQIFEECEKRRAGQMVKPRRGRLMPYFLVYDACALALTLVLFLPQALQTNHHAWMNWTTFFYVNSVYAILMIPFVLLKVSFIRLWATRAEPTAYDKAGLLGKPLTTAQIRFKREHEAALQESSTTRPAAESDPLPMRFLKQSAAWGGAMFGMKSRTQAKTPRLDPQTTRNHVYALLEKHDPLGVQQGDHADEIDMSGRYSASSVNVHPDDVGGEEEEEEEEVNVAGVHGHSAAGGGRKTSWLFGRARQRRPGAAGASHDLV